MTGIRVCIAVLAAMACAWVVSAPAPAATSACPDGIHAVPGGARDAMTNGYDDGARGPAEAYEPGEILVGLARGSGAGAIRCLTKGLGAIVLQGGPGAKGVAGVPGAVRVLLPPGISVQRTAALLGGPAGHPIIDWASPNGHVGLAVDPAPDDPGFARQWYLNPDAVAASIGTGSRYSVRARQGWGMGLGVEPVPVAVIDDGLAVHEDLARALSPDGSRTVGGEISGSGAIGFTEARGTVSVSLAGNDLCDFDAGDTLERIRDVFERRGRGMCREQGPTITQVLTVRASGGTFTLRTPAGPGDAEVAPETGPLNHGAFEDEIRDALHADTAFDTFSSRDVFVKRLAPAPDCSTDCARWAITTPGAQAPTLIADARGLQGTANGPATAEAVVSTMRVTPSTQRTPPGLARVVVVDTGLAGNAPMAVRGGRARLIMADLTPALEIPSISYANKKWPGAEAPGDMHGLGVAGVIAADTGNALAIAGTAGRAPVSLSAIRVVDSRVSDTRLADAIWYSTRVLRAKVVNMSLGGWLAGGDAVVRDTRVEDPAPPSFIQRAIGHPGPGSRALFVVAAGNEAGNLLSIGQRMANPYRGRRVDADPCRPKGMGITVRPAWPGGTKRDKGGTDSFLQMPDGTYDRGNLLCVAAVDANGSLSPFSNWGADVVDVAAPGSEMLVLGRDGNDPAQPSRATRTESGTSFAAPVVAGIAALVYANHPEAQPWMVKCAILSAATSRPIRPPVLGQRAALPFTGYVAGDGPGQVRGKRVLTVNGVPLAAEALSAYSALVSRVTRAREAERYGRARYPTCVQKRRYYLGVFGGAWRDTPVRAR